MKKSKKAVREIISAITPKVGRVKGPDPSWEYTKRPGNRKPKL